MPEKDPSTFYIHTFGCKVNSYESEAVKEELIGRGYRYVSAPPADIIIVNTCAVTLTAEKKDMERIRSLARSYPDSKLICLGCFAQLHPELILPVRGVKAVLGTSGRMAIPELIEADGRTDLVCRHVRAADYERLGISSFLTPVRAFVKIQDGCDNFCSYCVIPLTRGHARSRPREDILAEIGRLAANGYAEIVLTGIDTGSYKDEEGRGLSDLVAAIMQVEPKTFRVRISSIEESQIDDGLISLLLTEPRLNRHLHIPLQSGSPRILEAMHRKYSLSSFADRVRTLRKLMPDIALSTDIIVGFPGETEEDFALTMSFAEKAGFMRLHVFPYSKRPYTPAALMPGQVPREIARDRVRRLEALGDRLAAGYYDARTGKTEHLLVEEELPSEGRQRIFGGYTDHYIYLRAASGQDLVGRTVDIRLGRPGLQQPIKD